MKVAKSIQASRRSPQTPNRQTSFLASYMLSASASFVAVSVTYPIDFVKTRLQIGTNSRSANFFTILRACVRHEGVIYLYNGLAAACIGHLFYSGIRVTMYETLRESVLGRNEDGSFPMHKAATAAMIAGSCGIFFATPSDMVKVQMQTEGCRRWRYGVPAKYVGSIDAFGKLFSQRGLTGMWSGCTPNMSRGAVIQIGDLCMYDTVKQKFLSHTLMEDTIGTHALSSCITGFTSSCISTPLDVVRTRLFFNPNAYSGPLNCLVTIGRQEGLSALYRGFLPVWLRITPFQLTFYVTFEQLRRVAGLSSW